MISFRTAFLVTLFCCQALAQSSQPTVSLTAEDLAESRILDRALAPADIRKLEFVPQKGDQPAHMALEVYLEIQPKPAPRKATEEVTNAFFGGTYLSEARDQPHVYLYAFLLSCRSRNSTACQARVAHWTDILTDRSSHHGLVWITTTPTVDGALLAEIDPVE